MLIDPKVWRQYAVVIIANLSCLSSGWAIAWSSPVLLTLTNATQEILDKPLTTEEGSWIVSLGSIFGIPAALLSGVLADLMGRRTVLVLHLIPKMISWILIFMANNINYLYVARIVQGTCDSLAFAVVPMYTVEIASQEYRGSLGTCLQIFSTLGVVSMLCFGPFMSYGAIAIVGGCLSFVALIVIIVPESPHYYLNKGKPELALRSLTHIRGSESLAVEELKKLESERGPRQGKLSMLCATRASIMGFVMANVIALLSQFGGFNAVMFYLQTIFESTGTDLSSSISSAITGVTQLIASTLTLFIADRFRRKTILCSTSAMMAVGMVCLGTFFYLRDEGYAIQGFLQFLPLIAIMIVVFSYSSGFGSLMWPLIPELFSDETRSNGVSIALTTCFISVFIISKFFAQFIESVGAHQTYWLLGGINAACVFVLWLFLPETKGKSSKEIQESMQNRFLQI